MAQIGLRKSNGQSLGSELGQGLSHLVDHGRGIQGNSLVGELQHRKPCQLKGVRALGVTFHLCLGAVPAIAEQLNDQWDGDKPAVDPHGPTLRSRQHLLGLGSGQTGVADQFQESSLQPALPAATQLAAVDDVK